MAIQRRDIVVTGWRPKYLFPVETKKGTQWVAGGGEWEEVYAGDILSTSIEGAMHLAIALYHMDEYYIVTVEVEGDTRVAISDPIHGETGIYRRGETNE